MINALRVTTVSVTSHGVWQPNSALEGPGEVPGTASAPIVLKFARVMAPGPFADVMARTVDGGYMSSPSAISETTLDAVHMAFNAIYARLASATFEALVFDLRTLLQRYEAEYQEAPAEWLELHRRVAEATLTVAVSKRRPIDECEHLLAELRKLGWTDLHRRAQMETMFCGYCVRIGHAEVALPCVRALMASLAVENERQRNQTWINHLAACEKLLEGMEN